MDGQGSGDSREDSGRKQRRAIFRGQLGQGGKRIGMEARGEGGMEGRLLLVMQPILKMLYNIC